MPILTTDGAAAAFAKTVSSTAIGLTNVAIGFTAAQVAAASRVLITVETQSVRFAYDGTTPTAANGHLVAAGGTIALTGVVSIKKLLLIRVSTDATIQVTLEN